MVAQHAESYQSEELQVIMPEMANFAGEAATAGVIDFPPRLGMEATLAFVNWSKRNPYFNAVKFERDEQGSFYRRPDGSRAPLA